MLKIMDDSMIFLTFRNFFIKNYLNNRNLFDKMYSGGGKILLMNNY